MTPSSTSPSTASGQPIATTEQVLLAVQAEIAAKIENLDASVDPESSGGYAEQVRSLKAWRRGVGAVAVSLSIPEGARPHGHLAAEVLDLAKARLELGDRAGIFDFGLGASELTWQATE